MRLSLDKPRSQIRLLTQDSTEYNLVKKFPGLFRDGPSFFMPMDYRVAFNLVMRLSAKYEKLKVDPEVISFINVPFKLKELPTDFKFLTEPKDFQRIALRYAYTVRGGGLLLEPGMGKTKVVLDFIALMGFKRSVIVCPKPLLFVWEDECKKHRSDKSIYCVKTTEWDGEVDSIRGADIVVINYAKSVIMVDRLVDAGFEFMGVDEALIKDPTSGRTKALTWLGRQIPNRMLMSGTLVNNSPMDVFAPVRFLEPCLVGNSFFDFEQEYAIKVGKERKFVVSYRKTPEVKSILESVSIVMTKEKWLKLPPKKFFDIYVQPSDHQRETYNSLKSNYIANMWEKTVEVDNPLTLLCKLIQICSGFMYITKQSEIDELDDSQVKVSPKREVCYFTEQPKLMKLIELLQNDFKDRRVMVWYNMTAEGNFIETMLGVKGIKHLVIKGGEKDVGTKVRTFNKDKSYQVLLCQAKSVNYGVTVLGNKDEEGEVDILTGLESEVYTQIFYSLNFSLEVYLQQQDRIHRLGQERECEYYHLICNLEAERYILEKLKEKLDIRDQILQDIITRLGISM